MKLNTDYIVKFKTGTAEVEEAAVDAKRWIAWNFGDDFTLKECK